MPLTDLSIGCSPKMPVSGRLGSSMAIVGALLSHTAQRSLVRSIAGSLFLIIGLVIALERGPLSVSIDLKPALNYKELRDRLQRDFNRYSQRSYRTILKGLLPQKMIGPFIELTAIPPDKRGHQIVSEERERLLGQLKSLRFNIRSALPMASAMVTAGGVSLKEIDPRTMTSKLVTGLYFCGEVMDIDAETGGYNLQAAFSTGYVAGQNAAAFVSGFTR